MARSTPKQKKPYPGRAGGDRRGSAEDRRRRKRWMLAKWGNGRRCPCVHCLKPLTFRTVEADRIDPRGTYRRKNVQPACRSCNLDRHEDKSRSWVPPRLRKEKH